VRTVELAFTASTAICRAILSRRVRGELRRIFPELTAELNGRFDSARQVVGFLRMIWSSSQPPHNFGHKLKPLANLRIPLEGP
jgi:hypothetical protein